MFEWVLNTPLQIVSHYYFSDKGRSWPLFKKKTVILDSYIKEDISSE